MSPPLLRADDVCKRYRADEGLLARLRGDAETVHALDGVSLTVDAGEAVAVVGESGCGKTTLARTLLHLEEPTAGRVRHRGTDLGSLSESALRDRRAELQWVPQDAAASLDDRRTVGDAVGDVLRRHRPDVDVAATTASLLDRVGLAPATAARYPHELSGGQAARAAVARALAPDPDLLVVDEPTASLDVNESARLVGLLTDLRASRDLAVVHVAHDLSLVSYLADRVLVLYLGRVVEAGPTDAVLSPPYHPYTRALLSAVPEPDPEWTGDRIRLRGDPPSPTDPPDGCRFHTRCPVAREECAEWETDPSLTPVDDAAHRVACPYATEPWEPVAEENPGEEATDT
jgi:peptide/nickel transport system ATP-binding protein